jgi:hypothetical protein
MIKMSKVHVFWDNSNIHFVGLNQIVGVREPTVNPKLFRTFFKGLLQLALRNREPGKTYLAGSVPPQGDDLWDHIKAQGIEVELLERTKGNKENANDVSIQATMLRTMMDNSGTGDTFVILTGDGAGGLSGKGFLADLERAYKAGFKVELIAWEASLNRYLREFAVKYGLFIPLEKHYDEITFIERGRRPAPLNI